MSVAFIIFVEDLPYADMSNYPLIDQIMAMYGYQLCMIDRKGIVDVIGNSDNIFKSLDEAWASPQFESYTWVYLDASGKRYIDTYKHPENNVVYVIGSDDIEPNPFDGKSLKDLNGTIIKLRTVSGKTSWRSHAVAIATASTRFTLLKK